MCPIYPLSGNHLTQTSFFLHLLSATVCGYYGFGHVSHRWFSYPPSPSLSLSVPSPLPLSFATSLRRFDDASWATSPDLSGTTFYTITGVDCRVFHPACFLSRSLILSWVMVSPSDSERPFTDTSGFSSPDILVGDVSPQIQVRIVVDLGSMAQICS